jgi:regulator of telomere elongation helicase 1
MELFDIRDIPMAFPFKPYPCQLAYMDKVVQTLDQGHNALLESPTGTGKTLCLLVATLAWIQKRRPGTGSGSGSASGPGNGPKMTIKYENPSDMKLVKPMKPPVKVMGTTGPGSGASVSVIIYASRTHSQLSQVISELRASGYTPKMTVMGSREQLCIHDKISKLKGAKLNHACNASGAQRRCTFKNNLDTYTSSAGILDIEQLAELGREDQVCPYFLSRQNVTSSELVLLPYNYLIDASIRATLKIEWKDAIVILDEAHNLEKIASDASSFTLSSGDISACITVSVMLDLLFYILC